MNKVIAMVFAAVAAGPLTVIPAAMAGHEDVADPVVSATSAVPAPGMLLLFGAGLAIVGFALMRRRRRD